MPWSQNGLVYSAVGNLARRRRVDTRTILALVKQGKPGRPENKTEDRRQGVLCANTPCTESTADAMDLKLSPSTPALIHLKSLVFVRAYKTAL